MNERDHTGRTLVLAGGAGLLAWWLLSRRHGATDAGVGRDVGTDATPREEPARRSRCVVWIRAARIDVDGVAHDLPTVVALCRAAGSAEVHATGDAITGQVVKVLKALRDADVALFVSPDLARLVPAERSP